MKTVTQCFQCERSSDGCHHILGADGQCELAVVGPHGMVDWLSDDPTNAPAPETAYAEAHLGYVRGVKFELVMATPFTHVTGLTVEAQAERVIVSVSSRSTDGRFSATHHAELAAHGDGRLAWTISATFASADGATHAAPAATIEYGNVYPAQCGNGWLQTPDKRFSETLLTSADGTLWRFPHQHRLHYGHLLERPELTAARLGSAAFSGPEDRALLIETLATTHQPEWAICDMFYDLHCLLQTPPTIGPEPLRVTTRLRWADRCEAAALRERARAVTVPPALQATLRAPRIELGCNRFAASASVTEPDDAAAFIPDGQARMWDEARSVITLQQTTNGQLRWTLAPDSIAKPGTRLRVSFRARVQGQATLRLRLRAFAWKWQQHAHVDTAICESPRLTAGDWTLITLPTLDIPEVRRDDTVQVEWLLDGPGSAEISELDLRVEPWSA